jgi:two-component system phosphate regulon sensor histidine kinase PhoR
MLAVLTSMVEGVLVINAEEKVVLANAACARMFGWKPGEWNNRPFWEIMRHRELLDLLKRVLGRGVFENAEISIFMPEEKIIQAQASPVKNEKGRKHGVVCVLHDITHLKKLEHLRTEFVANVSHELKTPLTSIKGFVETLLGGALEDPATARNFLEIIDGHAARLERLISELLELARLENGELPLQLRAVDLKPLIQRSAHLFENEIRDKRQALEIECPPSLAPVSGDEEKLERALGNLIHNAVKFTPEEGKIKIRAWEDGGQVKISVSDTGIGIAEDQLPRIFERFYRVDKSRSRKEGGTGLGLSIVKHIAQAHAGSVSVESRAGKGSTFTLSLPKI